MHRDNLKQLLLSYNPSSPQEISAKQQMLDFLHNNSDCFERTLKSGHFTASCWLLNSTMDQALLTHHAKLDSWLQLGGHCDGDSDVLRVALKEAVEESGITEIKALSEAIFDIDVHHIPAYKSEPAHLHYDVRFLLQATTASPIIISNESKDLRWFSRNFNALPTHDLSIVRMFNKWLQLETVGAAI